MTNVNEQSRRSGFESYSLGSFVRVRRSKKADIITGAIGAGNTREQIATIRPPAERKAMGGLARRRLERHDGRWLAQTCWALCHWGTSAVMGTEASSRGVRRERAMEVDEGGNDGRPQYTLESRRGEPKSTLPCLSLRQSFCCSRSTLTSSEYQEDDADQKCLFLDINKLVKFYLSWAYRTSYLKLLLNFSMTYFLFIVAFALIYYGILKQWPMCVNSNGQKIGDVSRMFGDCFQLSWTTFSSVGYGIIFPATGASDFHVPTGCVGVGVLGSFEAFLGVLFAGFITSILFGKVLRSQNNAQVYFSDPIVVRYGKTELEQGGHSFIMKNDTAKGAKEGPDEEMGGDEGKGVVDTVASNQENIPCPSLEFRLVNRLHDTFSGEIVEAKLSCVAILDPKISESKPDAPTKGDEAEAAVPEVHEKTTVAELARVLRDANPARKNRHLNFHSADSKQPHMFTKIKLDADEHPFFRRVWFGRHRLNENSPLLTPSARHMVKLAGGRWPAELNNCQSIKNSIHFRNLLVCISGTSNATASYVYAQKVYDLVDATVGYRFVPMNYRTDEGTLRTDPYLLNAVYQQRGGGGEPISCHE